MTKYKIFIFLLLSGFIIPSYLFFTQTKPFLHWSYGLNDLIFTNHQKTSPSEMVYVSIDEKSVNTYGRWPWNRNILIEGLRPMSQAKSITLDMVFSDKVTNTPQSHYYDELLAQYFRQYNNTICGFFLRISASEETSSETKTILANSSLEKVFLPPHTLFETHFAEANHEPILSACTLNATFSTSPDEDGLFRRYPIAYIFDNKVYPSLGIQTLRLFYNHDVTIEKNGTFIQTTFDNNISFKANHQGFVYLNYYPLKSYTTLSFVDVAQGKISPSFFHNKIVILGISEAGVTDVRSTPIGLIPGPLLHYTFIANVLDHSLLTYIPWLTYLTFILVTLLIILSHLFFKKLSYRLYFYSATFLMLGIEIFTCYYFYYIFDIFYPLLGLLLSIIINEYSIFKKEEKNTSYIKTAFANYLSPQLLQELLLHPEKLSLGGENKELTIFFSDIRNFTTLSEDLTPERLVSLLNQYFSPMTEIILHHGGMVDKYIGDAIMAFYNAPLTLESHANEACLAALEISSRLKQLNIDLKKNQFPELTIGMGINTACVIVGNMGANHRFNYTVIGDGVNLASRLEGLNKIFGTQIIISESTKNALSLSLLIRPIEEVKVKGKNHSTMIYELLENNDLNINLVESYMKAYNLMLDHEFEKSLPLFYKLSQYDKLSEYFYEKLSKLNNTIEKE